MTALHFTSVTSSPSSSLQLLIQIHLFVCQWKQQWHFWQLWRKQIVLSYYVLTDLWCAISHTDSALVLTGSSNLCLMIVKLQRSLPWGKPSVHIWLTVVWLHIVKKLVESARRSPYSVFLFDEILNSAFQKEQIDSLIKFWNDTEYLDSKFLSQPNAKNLLEKLLEALTPLGLCNLIQVSIIISHYFVLWKTRFHVFLFQLKLVSWINPRKLDFDIRTLSLSFQLSAMMSLNFKDMPQSSHFIKCNRMCTLCHMHKYS